MEEPHALSEPFSGKTSSFTDEFIHYQTLRVLVIRDIDLESATKLVEWVLKRPDEIFDLCFACGNFNHKARRSNSLEQEAIHEGEITCILAQLENIVCRVVYIPGPSDPAALWSSVDAPRLTGNSQNLHGRSLKLVEGLCAVGFSEPPEDNSSEKKSLSEELADHVVGDLAAGAAVILFHRAPLRRYPSCRPRRRSGPPGGGGGGGGGGDGEGEAPPPPPGTAAAAGGAGGPRGRGAGSAEGFREDMEALHGEMAELLAQYEFDEWSEGEEDAVAPEEEGGRSPQGAAAAAAAGDPDPSKVFLHIACLPDPDEEEEAGGRGAEAMEEEEGEGNDYDTEEDEADGLFAGGDGLDRAAAPGGGCGGGGEGGGAAAAAAARWGPPPPPPGRAAHLRPGAGAAAAAAAPGRLRGEGAFCVLTLRGPVAADVRFRERAPCNPKEGQGGLGGAAAAIMEEEEEEDIYGGRNNEQQGWTVETVEFRTVAENHGG